MTDDRQTHIFLFLLDCQVEECLPVCIREELSCFRQQQIDTIYMSGGGGQVQGCHAQTIDRVDEMSVSLEDGVHGGHMSVGRGIVERSVAFVALAELSTFVDEKLHDASVSILAGEMERCLSELIGLVENTLEPWRVQQLPACIISTVPKGRESQKSVVESSQSLDV